MNQAVPPSTPPVWTSTCGSCSGLADPQPASSIRPPG